MIFFFVLLHLFFVSKSDKLCYFFVKFLIKDIFENRGFSSCFEKYKKGRKGEQKNLKERQRSNDKTSKSQLN